MLNFYMTPGSCSTGIHIVLEELELIFSAHIVNLPAGDNRKPEYLAINPKGTIPVLVLDDETALTEFSSIAWWLAQTYPKAQLLPGSLSTQAKMLDMMNYVVSVIHMQGFTRIFTTERYSKNTRDHELIINQGKEIVHEGFANASEYLASNANSPTQRITIFDAALFYVEFWATRLDLAMPENCVAHYNQMISRPVVKRVLMEEGYRV